MSVKDENIIELEADPVDGVFKPARVVKRERAEAEEEEKPKKVKRQRVTKSSQRREIQRMIVAQYPQVEQFVTGANIAFDLVERFRKAFK